MFHQGFYLGIAHLEGDAPDAVPPPQPGATHPFDRGGAASLVMS
jgi:hypothetical protein